MQQRWFLYSALISLAALLVALVSQHVFGLRPCAWCVFQRLLLLAIIGLSLIGYIAMRYKTLWLGFLCRIVLIATAFGGILSAWYQQTVAAKLFSCDMTFADQVMISSGLESSMPWLFGIYTTCMDASVAILGLDYAIWALLLFVALLVINTLALFSKAVD